MTGNAWRRAGLCAAATAILACGGEEAPELNAATTQAIGASVERKSEPAAAAAEMPGIPDAAIVGNRAPRLKGVQVDPAGQITAGADVTVIAGAVDPDGDEVTYLFTWWVNGDEVDESGPTLSTGGLEQGDTVRVQVIATDGSDESSPMISPLLPVVNGAPRIVSTPEWDTSTGKLTYQVRAEDPEGDTDLRFALAKAPTGMTVSPIEGLIQWLPGAEQMGTHPIEIVVTDSAGGRGSQTFELTLDPPADQQPPAAAAR